MLPFVEAVACVRMGGLVVYPTETFMGIGCDAFNADAVARVYQAKRRSVQLPLPVIISDFTKISLLAVYNTVLDPLVQKFWPGPLTILLPALPCVPTLLTGGTGRVALRVSSHPAAHVLSAAAGGALVSSSANISGMPAVTTFSQLDPQLLAAVDGVVCEGPEPAGGKPSTLVELVDSHTHAGSVKPVLRLLRHGVITVEQLEEAGYCLHV